MNDSAANDRAIRTSTTSLSDAAAALRVEAAELAAEYALRRFALCWLDPDDDDGGILAWGLDLPFGKVVLTLEDGHILGSFASPENARSLLACKDEVVLVWLDEPAHFAAARPEPA